MCILAIISAVKKSVTQQSTAKVIVWSEGYFSKDFGVLSDTDTKLIRAQSLKILLTHSCKKKVVSCQYVGKKYNKISRE